MSIYPWPGNIRELNNWIERASILEEYGDAKLVVSSLPLAGTSSASTSLGELILSESSPTPPSAAEVTEPLPLSRRRKELLDHHEHVWISRALERAQGNVSAAARELGIDRKNLSRRMKELGLQEKAKTDTSPTRRKKAS